MLAALGPALGEILLGYGNNTNADGRYLGLVFAIFSLGLMPYMLFQLLLRVFYAMHDSKTPALIGVVTMVTNVAANLIAVVAFPPSQVVAALGVGFGLANLVGTMVAWRVLSKRLGGLAGREIGRALTKMHAAALPAGLFALAVAIVVTLTLGAGQGGAFAVVAAGGAGALVIYPSPPAPSESPKSPHSSARSDPDWADNCQTRNQPNPSLFTRAGWGRAVAAWRWEAAVLGGPGVLTKSGGDWPRATTQRARACFLPKKMRCASPGEPAGA